MNVIVIVEPAHPDHGPCS